MYNVDVCVLTAGRFDLLEKCLDSIRVNVESDLDTRKVYILDNGSDINGSTKRDILNQPFITRVKRLGQNRGFAAGANYVIKMGTAPLVMFVSDDVVLKPGTISQLINTMEDKTIGLCGLKLLFPNTPDQYRPAGKVQHVGHTINLKGDVIHPFLGWSPENPRCNVSGQRISVTGATFMVRRDVFNRAGRFNEQYGAGYYEDVELCLHIGALGYKIWVDTNAVAEHYVGATYGYTQPSVDFKNNKALFMKNNQANITWTDWQVR